MGRRYHDQLPKAMFLEGFIEIAGNLPRKFVFLMRVRIGFWFYGGSLRAGTCK